MTAAPAPDNDLSPGARRMRRYRARRRRGTSPLMIESSCTCIADGREPSSTCPTAMLGCFGWEIVSRGLASAEELADPEQRPAAIGRCLDELLEL